MGSETRPYLAGYQSGSPRQRAVSATLAAAIVLIALLVALYQTQVAPRLEKARNPVTFNVAGEDADSGRKEPEKKKERAEKREEKKEPTPQVRTEAPVPPVEAPVKEKPAFSFLKLSRSEMASADIGNLKQQGSGDPAPSKGSSGSTYGPGEGPGGAVLYNADWYRRPTDAQLGGYLRAGMPPSGWGMIACQTMEHYQVENCQILGESPRGSGYGRAVLDAAWQFQVLPPRINGKPQIGVWVRIRIDYAGRGASTG